MTDPAELIRSVPPGAALFLRAGEWRSDDFPRGSTYRDVRVDRIHERVEVKDGASWVGVTGHELECRRYAFDDPHPPCLHLMVRVDAIPEAARR